MIELTIGFLLISFLYGIRLYFTIGNRVDFRDIVLTSFLGPSVLWMKVYGYVLSLVGISVYYMFVFDEENNDQGV